MRITALLAALGALAASATPFSLGASGGPVWCTVDTAAQGLALYQRTKDCCAAAGGPHARFNEIDQLCEGILGSLLHSHLSAPLPASTPQHPSTLIADGTDWMLMIEGRDD
jgi:hypothetical protein